MADIAVSELRANLKEIIAEVEHGARVQVTSRGKVIAQLIPPDSTKAMALQKLNALAERTKKASSKTNSKQSIRQ